MNPNSKNIYPKIEKNQSSARKHNLVVKFAKLQVSLMSMFVSADVG